MNYLLLLIASAGAVVSLLNVVAWYGVRDVELLWILALILCIAIGVHIIIKIKEGEK